MAVDEQQALSTASSAAPNAAPKAVGMCGDAATSMSPLKSSLQAEEQLIVQKIQRDLNRLMDPLSDRTTKRRALEALAKETVGLPGTLRPPPLDQVSSPAVVGAVFSSIHKSLLRLLADSVEKCRELALQVVAGFYARLEGDSLLPFLAYLIPVLVDRTGTAPSSTSGSSGSGDRVYAQQEAVEPSEEIRLQIVLLLQSIVEKAGARVAPCVEDVVMILSKTLADPYPEVKKESCKLVRLLVDCCPREIGMQHTVLTKAILSNCLHKHANVRAATLQAFGHLVKADASPLEESTNLDLLRRAIHDKSGAVREALYATLGMWMVELRDRYGFAPKLLPLFLPAFTDELDAIRSKAWKWADAMGKIYEEDWAERLKDEMDFSPDNAEETGRPRIGCRHLFRDHTMKIVNALMAEANGWTVESRYRGLQALETLFIFSEHNMTGYTGPILQTLLRHIENDEAHVKLQTTKVAEKMAVFVDPQVYLDILGPLLQQASTAPAAKGYTLKLLAHLLKGMQPASRVQDQLDRIITLVTEESLAESDHSDLLVQLVAVLQELLRKVSVIGNVQLTPEQSFRVFYALLCASSHKSTQPGLSESANGCLHELAKIQGLESVSMLYESLGVSRLLPLLTKSVSKWNTFSPQLRVLQWFMMRTPETVLSSPEFQALFFDQLLFPLATREHKEEDGKMTADWDVRGAALTLANQLVREKPALFKDTKEGMSVQRSREFLQKLIIPNGVWRGGRRAEQNRSLCMEFSRGLIEQEWVHMDAIVDDLAASESAPSTAMKVFVACFDEDLVSTREHALHVMNHLFQQPALAPFWPEEFAKLVYVELLKRLDDSRDEIRCLAAKTFASFLASPGGCPSTLDHVHFEAMIKGIVIHLDDANPEVHQAAAEALRRGCQGVLPKTLLKEVLTDARGKFRCVQTLDSILAQLNGS